MVLKIATFGPKYTRLTVLLMQLEIVVVVAVVLAMILCR